MVQYSLSRSTCVKWKSACNEKMFRSVGILFQAGFTVYELFATQNLLFHIEQFGSWRTYKNLPWAHLVHWQ
jgi:hypothetical protein